MDFETSIEIDAPRERVWATLVDVDRWPEWTASVRAVKRLDPTPLSPDAKVEMKQPRLPKLVWEVTEFRPEQSFAWTSTTTGVTTVARHEVVPRGDGVAVTLGIEHAGALAPLVRLLTGARTRRYMRMEVEGLKRRSEA